MRPLLISMMLANLLGSSASGGWIAEDTYRAGAARRDITPDGPIWMSGYGNRNRPSEAIDQRLFARALALEDPAGNRAVLVSADLIGFSGEFTEAIAARVAGELGVPRERFLLVATHTHTGPVVHHSLGGMFDLTGREAEAVEGHTKECAEQIFEAASEAVGRLRPARLSFARGRATFAANRRVFRAQGVAFGVNPEGPVDHDVPVLRVDELDGKTLAIAFGYACHCTTLGGDHYRIGGDWAGYAQEYLELANPGATALFVTGCGADANPEPRGKLEFARQHGLHMAGAVTAAMGRSPRPIRGLMRAGLDRARLPLSAAPGRDEFQKRLSDKNPFVQRHARRFLSMLDDGQELPSHQDCPVQVWQFGDDLTLVALGGEVVVDYALRLKRELGDDRTWVAGYSNDVFAYVPSVRILLEGGYEADFNLIYYDIPSRFDPGVEETLVQSVRKLVQQVQEEVAKKERP